jgi:hypothetical protein
MSNNITFTAEIEINTVSHSSISASSPFTYQLNGSPISGSAVSNKVTVQGFANSVLNTFAVLDASGNTVYNLIFSGPGESFGISPNPIVVPPTWIPNTLQTSHDCCATPYGFFQLSKVATTASSVSLKLTTEKIMVPVPASGCPAIGQATYCTG